MYTLVFNLAIVNKVLRHCHSWLAQNLIEIIKRVEEKR